MSSDSQAPDPLAPIADEIVERLRRGERPLVSDYVAQYPDLARRIRQLFPALMMMEQLGESEAAAPRTLAADGCDFRAARRATMAGETLGDYQIVRELGRGGMGIVYEAEQMTLRRRVALKILPPQIAHDPRALERFRHEAQAAARLHHTNIVPVFDVGREGDSHFYAMQFIPGQGLDRVLAELRRRRRPSSALSGAGSTGGRSAGAVADTAMTGVQDGTDGAAAAQTVDFLLSGFGRNQGADTKKGALDANARQAAAAGSGPSAPGAPGPATKVGVSQGSTITDGRRHAGADAPPTAGDSLSSSSGPGDLGYYQAVARIGIQVAEALSYAHDRGILHRDIKPSNIMLDQTGTAWVADFGLAKSQGGSLTRTGDIVGTIHYMAPERFKGEGDGRSDVYALGLTLYELLTLESPYRATDHLALIREVTSVEPPRPRRIDRHLPADLETIVCKAIDKDPARRYQTAAGMADDLRRFLDYRPILARQTSYGERLWRWCRRNPVVAGVSGLALSLLVTVVVVSTGYSIRLTDQLVRTQSAQQAERTALVNERTARQIGDRSLFEAYLHQSRAERASRRQGQRFTALQAIRNALALTDRVAVSDDERQVLQNEAIAALCLVDTKLLSENVVWTPETRAVQFDDKFERYVRRLTDARVEVRTVGGEQPIAQLGPLSARVDPLLSHTGRYVAVRHGAPARITVWDLAVSPPTVMLQTTVTDGSEFTFSPDDSLLAIVGAKGVTTLIALSDPTNQRPLTVTPDVTSLGFHPHRKLLVCGEEEMMHVCEVESGREILAIAREPVAGRVRWRSDGLGVVNCSPLGRVIESWDITGKRPGVQYRGHENLGVDFAFDSAGRWMASVDWGGSLRLWDAHSGVQLLELRGLLLQPGFHAELPRLATLDQESGKLQIWEIGGGDDAYRSYVRESGEKPHYSGAARVIGGGRILACRMETGIAFWDFATGDPLTFVTIGKWGNFFAVDAHDAIITNDIQGVFRWPTQRAAEDPARIDVGPPERLSIPGYTQQIDCSKDGQVIATALDIGVVVLHRGAPDRRLMIDSTPPDTRFVALSPDGKQVAAGGHEGAGVRIFDAESGQLVRELLPDVSINEVRYSPDGRWLVTSGGGCRLWNVADWSLAHRIGGAAFAFSPDSKVLAVETGRGLVRLVDVASGAELARLEDPSQDIAFYLAFSPDGSKLLATTHHAVHAWDLDVLCVGLAGLGLDGEFGRWRKSVRGNLASGAAIAAQVLPRDEWGLPNRAFGQSVHLQLDRTRIHDAINDRDAVREVSAAHRHRAALRYVAEGNWKAAIGQWQLAAEQYPDWSKGVNALARALAICPQVDLRDPARSLELARHCVKAAPESSRHWHTLGLALLRIGQCHEALEALERTESLSPGQDAATGGFVRALALEQLGETVAARRWFDWAAQWLAANPTLITRDVQLARELSQLEWEAKMALGLPGP